MNKRIPLSRLYSKITMIFMGLLVLLGAGYFFITSYTAKRYIKEVNQQLYGSVAEHLVKETKPLVNGKPDTAATHDIMHSMMVINRSVEVYLLDTVGQIIDYVVPYKTVKRKRVDLAPVWSFIDSEGKDFILGDDPKDPDSKNVFSAAPIYENEKLSGYAYIILAGEEQEAVTSTIRGSYMLKLGFGIFLTTLIGALLIGLLAMWFFTGSLRKITEVVKRFKEGRMDARVDDSDKGDLIILADTFNEMADKIVENIEQLKSIDKLKQELIANVSHDLRTPLAIMRGYIETLLMKKNELSVTETDKYLNTILSSSSKLSTLVGQLFEYSKLEANQIEIQKEPFFISELVNDMMAKYQILAAEKNIRLEMDIPEDLPLVFADIALVERAIQNLIDNALKFTPTGGTVKIRLNALDNDVEVSIADNGPGIPLKEQSYIFERYRKADNNAVSSNKGAGLGLAIVKKILEFHNSTIQVKSQPDQGAMFWFSLPVHHRELAG